MKKGSKLYVEGKITTKSWEDKETRQTRYRTEILVNELVLLSGREEGGSGASRGGSSAGFDQRPAASAEDLNQAAEISDDDIPF